MKKDRILGIPFNNLNEEEILKQIESFFNDDREHTVLFLSVPLLIKARRNKPIRVFLEEADLVIPSGKWIYWAADFLGKPVRQKIDPSSLVKRILVQSTNLNKKVYIFGGKQNSMDIAIENLKKEIPRLFLIGKHSRKYRISELDDLLYAIRKASPDYFFIGLGSPEEEYWIINHRQKINSKVVVLIESLIDVYSGKARRSYYLRNFDVEKAVSREIANPHRFKRIFLILPFILMIIIEKIFWKN
ncbi:MAG: hypothetical protein DRP84_04105 [Spirochaetes bacterium]|nr:MAG: hypothetical protein DRP84_04105 [Spirochaetota bacterium]